MELENIKTVLKSIDQNMNAELFIVLSTVFHTKNSSTILDYLYKYNILLTMNTKELILLLNVMAPVEEEILETFVHIINIQDISISNKPLCIRIKNLKKYYLYNQINNINN